MRQVKGTVVHKKVVLCLTAKGSGLLQHQGQVPSKPVHLSARPVRLFQNTHTTHNTLLISVKTRLLTKRFVHLKKAKKLLGLALCSTIWNLSVMYFSFALMNKKHCSYMVYAQRWFLLTTWMTEQQNPLWCLHTDDTLLEQKWSDCGIFWIDDKLGKRTAMRWDIHYEFTSEIPRRAWWSSSSKLPSASIWARRILMHLQKPVSDCRASLSRVARINHSTAGSDEAERKKKLWSAKTKKTRKLASQSDLCDISLFMSTETCWQADISNRLEQLTYLTLMIHKALRAL